ncbi:MAG: YhcB family protein [Zoogloeaceae bacterium]|nr:YhcB family protein [Zoogloeaceae bacterium]
MSGQALWAFVIVIVVAAAVLGYFFGRVSTGGMKQKLRETEEALERKDSEMAAYRREVDAHFDKSATLFVSMAGSYKAMFEHLSSGYEKLSDGSSQDLFRQRVATLLLDEQPLTAPAQGEATEPGPFAEEGPDDTRSDEAEALLADAHPRPVAPAEIAESEEREAQQVDPVQADAEAARAMEEERREPTEHITEETVAETQGPRRD